MEKQGQVVERLATNSVTAARIQAFGTLAMIGGALLTIGAILVDLGWFVDLPAITSLGNALSAISGLGLLFPPFGLRASHLGGKGILATAGTVTLAIGILLASLVDVPTILDPTDLEPGGAMGPIGLLLLSIGFLAWFVAIRRAGGLAGWRLYGLVAAGLWFPLSFPTVQLPLFVISAFRDPERQTIVYAAGRSARYAATHDRDGSTRAYGGKRSTADALNDA